MKIKRKLYSSLIPVKAGLLDPSIKIIGKESKNLSKSAVQKIRNNCKNVISSENLPKSSSIISSSLDKNSSLAILGVRGYVKSGKYAGKKKVPKVSNKTNNEPKVKVSKTIAKGEIIDQKLGKNSYRLGKIKLKANGEAEHLPNVDGQLSLFRPGDMSYKQ